MAFITEIAVPLGNVVGFEDNPGSQADLKRHLLCIDAKGGKVVWQRAVDAVLSEDPYRSNIREHGYASNTPVTDGERVYLFFGKTGVLAFDMQGKKLWQTSVGTGSSNSPTISSNPTPPTSTPARQ